MVARSHLPSILAASWMSGAPAIAEQVWPIMERQPLRPSGAIEPMVRKRCVGSC